MGAVFRFCQEKLQPRKPQLEEPLDVMFTCYSITLCLLKKLFSIKWDDRIIMHYERKW